MNGMRISSLLGKITVVVVICCCCLPAQAKYGGGSGTAGAPYLIFDANQMNAIGADQNDWDKHFKLMANIDLAGFTGTSFNIIGIDYYNPFTGVFDGNSHTISNFTYTSTGTDYIGLFGYVENAEIKDLGLIDPNVNAETGYRIGGLAGYNSGTISNSYAIGTVTGDKYVGGLVGENRGGTITNCYATGSVAGHWYVGGLVGYNDHGNISNCYNTGTITGSEYTGGLVGANELNGTISECYAKGNALGGTTGGLVGENRGTILNCYATGGVYGYDSTGGLVGSNEGRISNCYSTGSVSGSGGKYYYPGGLVGSGAGQWTINSFWDVNSSGQSQSAGGTGKTTAEMKAASTFLGWGCGGTWTLNEGLDYPRLSWENKPGELLSSLDDFVAGIGTIADPYMIYTAEELNLIGLFLCELDKHFVLANDINLADYTGAQFNIIGNINTPFVGVFDGNSHTISNFTYECTSIDYIGILGYVDDPNGEIKDLTLIDTNINAENSDYVGSLVGYLRGGAIVGCSTEGGSVSGDGQIGGLVGGSYSATISNCYATGNVSGRGHIGGLVGENSGTTISNCYVTGTVSGSNWTGGLVGWHGGTLLDCYATCMVLGTYDYTGGLVGGSYSATISNCYATGSVSGRHECVGGLVGYNYAYTYGMISNSYAIGNVDGNEYSGGLVGRNKGTISKCYATGTVGGVDTTGGLVGINEGTISNCYTTGSISGDRLIGGLVGYNYEGTISKCYATGTVDGNIQVGGLAGHDYGSVSVSFWDIETGGPDNGIGTPLTTEQMQTRSTFTDAGWDFVDIWDICEGTNYPKLVWSIPVADFVCPDDVNFFDFSFFAGHWQEDNCGASNDCDGTDLDQCDTVDINDLGIFVDNWLRGF